MKAFQLGACKLPEWFKVARRAEVVVDRNYTGKWHGQRGHILIKSSGGVTRAYLGDWIAAGDNGRVDVRSMT